MPKPILNSNVDDSALDLDLNLDDLDLDDLDLDDLDLDLDIGVDVGETIQPLVDRVKYQNKVETDAYAEANEILKAFKARAAKEKTRVQNATDSEYWCCLCFQTREQKIAFLKALKLLSLGDKYLDGQKVAKKLGVTLPSADISYRESRIDTKTAALTRTIRKRK